LEVGIDVVLKPHCHLLVVFTAPLSVLTAVYHNFSLVNARVRLFVVLERHAIKFAEILLDFVLAEEGRAPEAHFVRLQGAFRPRKHHFVADKVLEGSRLFETRGNRRLDALRQHVLLKVETFLEVLVQLVQVVLFRVHRGFKVAKVLGVEVAHLGGIAHIEVDLVRVEAKALHFSQFSPNYKFNCQL